VEPALEKIQNETNKVLLIVVFAVQCNDVENEMAKIVDVLVNVREYARLAGAGVAKRDQSLEVGDVGGVPHDGGNGDLGGVPHDDGNSQDLGVHQDAENWGLDGGVLIPLVHLRVS